MGVKFSYPWQALGDISCNYSLHLGSQDESGRHLGCVGVVMIVLDIIHKRTLYNLNYAAKEEILCYMPRLVLEQMWEELMDHHIGGCVWWL